MKTCRRFDRIREDFQADIARSLAHAAQRDGTRAATASRTHAANARQAMAQKLSRHFANCPECS